MDDDTLFWSIVVGGSLIGVYKFMQLREAAAQASDPSQVKRLQDQLKDETILFKENAIGAVMGFADDIKQLSGAAKEAFMRQKQSVSSLHVLWTSKEAAEMARIQQEKAIQEKLQKQVELDNMGKAELEARKKAELNNIAKQESDRLKRAAIANSKAQAAELKRKAAGLMAMGAGVVGTVKGACGIQ